MITVFDSDQVSSSMSQIRKTDTLLLRLGQLLIAIMGQILAGTIFKNQQEPLVSYPTGDHNIK